MGAQAKIAVLVGALAACGGPGAASRPAHGTDGAVQVDARAERGSPTIANVEEGHWHVGGTTLRYRIVGRGSPIVLLHGGPGGNMQTFRSLEDELGAEYRLIMYDQRGAGESARLPIDPAHPDPNLISVDRNVEDLEDIRQLLGLERLVLVGHSWGATLAVFYAAKYPERVERMVINNGGPVWPELSAIRQRAMRDRMAPRTRVRFAEMLAELEANILDWTQDELDMWFVGVGEIFMPVLVCQDAAAHGTATSPEADTPDLGRGGFWANHLTNSYEDTLELGPLLEQLRAVHAPTLLTHGRCEPNPIDRVVVLRDALPDARLVVFDNSGHQPLLEERELFLSTLRAFLTDTALPMPTYHGAGQGVPY